MAADVFHTFEEQMLGWANTRPHIRGVLVVGSYARSDIYPPDQWSDLDVIIFTTRAEELAADPQWLAHFGDVWARALNRTPRGDPEWLVLYAGGTKIDALLSQVPPAPDPIDLTPFDMVLVRGARVLLDRDGGLNAALLALQPPAEPPPTPQAFAGLLNNLWLAAVRALKFAARGDLWRAKMACDAEMKTALLTLLEWHARALYPDGTDTWYDGRFVERWADPRAAAELPHTFAHYTADDIRRATLATLALAAWLAQETAAKLNLPEGLPAHEQVLAWLQDEFGGDRSGI